MERLEEMSEFFAARLSEYDEHMLSCVEGCREGYIKMAELVPKNAKTLLDLGCGTGLELYEIFKRIPDMEVTGVDLTAAMLQRLREKYPDKKLNLICGDYFTVPFGRDFDCVISFQTMHHFKKDKKAELYKKIYSALADKGVYIECDYMVLTQQEEDLWFAENDRIRKEQGLGEDEFYHYDTPCTIDNQIALFKGAGFKDVKMTFRQENTTMLIARK